MTPTEDPLAELGLGPDATEADIRAAYRRRAKLVHPDIGGLDAAMAALNATVARALSIVAAASPATPPEATTTHEPPPVAPQERRGVVTMVDHPSFTIEALPAVAYEALVACATEMALVVEDPPYLLEVEFDEPFWCWCRLELFPDAGATTVALTVRTTADGPGLEAVRDRWIGRLNRLDWTDLEALRP